jgi:hypothetical protein
MLINLRNFFTALLLSFGLVLGFMPSAQAHHVGPFVKNEEELYVKVMWKNHDTGYFQSSTVSSGAFSPRGASAVWKPRNGDIRYRLIIRSIVTDRYYTGGCDASIQIGNGDGTGNSAVVEAILACTDS